MFSNFSSNSRRSFAFGETRQGFGYTGREDEDRMFQTAYKTKRSSQIGTLVTPETLQRFACLYRTVSETMSVCRTTANITLISIFGGKG